MEILIFQIFILLFTIVFCLFFPWRISVFFLVLMSLVSFLSGVPNANYQGFYLQNLAAYFPPFALLSTGILILYRIYFLKGQIEATKEASVQMEMQMGEVLENFNQVNTIRENLEKRILKNEDFVLKLQEAVSDLSSLDYEDMKPKVLELCHQFCMGRAIGWYEMVSGDLILQNTYLCENKKITKKFAKDDPVCQFLLSKSGVLDFGKFPFEVDFVLAQALFNSEGKNLGAIIVFDMDFLDVHLTNLRLFQMLGNWVSQEIDKALKYETRQMDLIKMHNFLYFVQSLYGEFLRVRESKNEKLVISLVFSFSKKMDSGEIEVLTGNLFALIRHFFSQSHGHFFNEWKGDRVHFFLDAKIWEQNWQVFEQELEQTAIGFNAKIEIHYLEILPDTEPALIDMLVLESSRSGI